MTVSWAVQREYRVPLHPLQGHRGLTGPPCVLRGRERGQGVEREVEGWRGGKGRVGGREDGWRRS